MDGPQNVPAPNVLALPQAPDAIELRHLRAFVAVADDLSFSRAAQRLFISQPALSRQIRGLERLVGCDLFRRSTQRVELTLAGEALLARARALLADLDDAISVTRSVGGELAGRMALLWEPWARASADVADLDGIRAALEELHGQFTPPPDVAVAPVIAGGVPALRVTPEISSPATVLFLHGGGHVAGSAFGYRHLAAAIALAARAPALVIDYRLAPEHPYPAAVQDAVNAYLWLRDTGGDEGRIVVAGDSSAGGLVMSLLLALRERDLPEPAGAALLCPWVDLTGRTQRPPQDSPLVFSPEMAHRLAQAYLAGHPADDPLLSPLQTSLAGLPPLLIQAASGDAVLQEAQLLARHATQCGVDASITVYPVPTHDFHVFWSFLPEARDAIDQLGRFVRTVASPPAESAAPSPASDTTAG
ncbi:MAG TPA: alpha/beta hydrolase fold domain-containing protein [Streptosporangiaceae bacterium]|nr:alpha/beta hydrolase fold domain-containing protein [Streptosporangiaceae bacterium]